MKLRSIFAVTLVIASVYAQDPWASWRGDYYRRNGLSMIAVPPQAGVKSVQKKFEVSRVGSTGPGHQTREKLLELFDVVKIEQEKTEDLRETVELIQNIDPGHYLAESRSRGLISLKILNPQLLPDGTVLKLNLLKKGVYSYVDVRGAKRSVPDYNEVLDLSEKVEFTQEKFIKALRSGQRYEAHTIESLPCESRCYRGKRKGRINERNESPDKEYTCEACGGAGAQEAHVDWVIVW